MSTVTQPGSTELRATPRAYPFPAATQPPGTHQEDSGAGRGAYSHRDPSAPRAPQGRGSSGLKLGPHPSRQAAIQAGHRDTGTLCGQPARQQCPRWAACPRRLNRVRGRSGGPAVERHTGPGETISIPPFNVPGLSQPRGHSLACPPRRPAPRLRAPKPPRPGRRPPPPPRWGPREAVALATAPSPWQRGGRHAGAGPARSISRPQAGPGGLRGFPPGASGAAGEGAMRGGKGSALPRCWGCPPSGVRGRSPGKGIVPRRLWSCPWSQGDRGEPDNASQSEGQSLTAEP